MPIIVLAMTSPWKGSGRVGLASWSAMTCILSESQIRIDGNDSNEGYWLLLKRLKKSDDVYRWPRSC